MAALEKGYHRKSDCLNPRTTFQRRGDLLLLGAGGSVDSVFEPHVREEDVLPPLVTFEAIEQVRSYFTAINVSELLMKGSQQQRRAQSGDDIHRMEHDRRKSSWMQAGHLRAWSSS